MAAAAEAGSAFLGALRGLVIAEKPDGAAASGRTWKDILFGETIAAKW